MSSVYKSIVAGLTEAIEDNRSADKKLKSIMRQKYRQFGKNHPSGSASRILTMMEMMEVFYASPAVLSNGSAEIFKNDVENCVGTCPYLEGYIFHADGNIRGYAMVAKSFSTEFGKPCIWIEDLYIKSEYRGLGIGSKFFSYIEEKYPDAVLRLEVEKENERAIKVYEKCGYEVLPYLEMKKQKVKNKTGN